MFTLSTKAKEAIKIGLAMTVAYYVAMRSAWMSPTWAAIAVAFISLPTAGQSINKGMLRIGGAVAISAEKSTSIEATITARPLTTAHGSHSGPTNEIPPNDNWQLFYFAAIPSQASASKSIARSI